MAQKPIYDPIVDEGNIAKAVGGVILGVAGITGTLLAFGTNGCPLAGVISFLCGLYVSDCLDKVFND